VLALQKTLLEFRPDAPEPGVWNFATDGRYLHHAGIPCIGFGPGDQDLAHTTKEQIQVIDRELHISVLEKFCSSTRQVRNFEFAAVLSLKPNARESRTVSHEL
jgi:acetylornithine deacetylase/succinyl-diaminopimelate desuccinylase-like protein